MSNTRHCSAPAHLYGEAWWRQHHVAGTGRLVRNERRMQPNAERLLKETCPRARVTLDWGDGSSFITLTTWSKQSGQHWSVIRTHLTVLKCPSQSPELKLHRTSVGTLKMTVQTILIQLDRTRICQEEWDKLNPGARIFFRFLKNVFTCHDAVCHECSVCITILLCLGLWVDKLLPQCVARFETH